jgi:hypothetical protein
MVHNFFYSYLKRLSLKVPLENIFVFGNEVVCVLNKLRFFALVLLINLLFASDLVYCTNDQVSVKRKGLTYHSNGQEFYLHAYSEQSQLPALDHRPSIIPGVTRDTLNQGCKAVFIGVGVGLGGVCTYKGYGKFRAV